jgi:Tol biopolymer transport system component
MRRQRLSLIVILALLLSGVIASQAAAAPPGNDSFQRTWARTDRPVADLVVSRTWMWGPEATTALLSEPYLQSPGGTRQVQYFDKSRMEITQPGAVDDGLWYVTNGLLVVEMMSGQLQIGDMTFETREPAFENVAGDPGQPVGLGLPYALLADLRSEPAHDEGAVITARVDRFAGSPLNPPYLVISDDPSKAAFGVTAEQYVPETQHRVASVFWAFVHATGAVVESGQLVTAPLFQNPFYATGLPITEAYWARVAVAGTPKDVLVQCFERRCLTYTPDNPPGWQVEAGNVGLHYHQWRYGMLPLLAFTSTRSGDGDIYIVDIHGGGLRRLTEGRDRDIEPAWSPDGHQIAFVRDYRDGSGSGIYVANADGSGLTNLIRHAGPYGYPTWSPDGSRIAFTAGVRDSPVDWTESLYVMNADGSNLRRLTDPAMLVYSPPSWSPDGMRIVFNGSITLERGGIFVVHADGSGLAYLSSGFVPSWSPDRTRIAFVFWDNVGPHLASMTDDGSDVTILADVFSSLNPPSWSPDGRQVAFFHAPHGYNQIHIINSDGTGLAAVTDSGGSRDDILPKWSPDGSRIIFTARHVDGNSDVWVVRPDGTGLTNVSNHPDPDVQPAWQGGGQGSRP